MIAFSDFFTPAQYAQFKSTKQADFYSEPHLSDIKAALSHFLLAKRDAGEISPVRGSVSLRGGHIECAFDAFLRKTGPTPNSPGMLVDVLAFLMANRVFPSSVSPASTAGPSFKDVCHLIDNGMLSARDLAASHIYSGSDCPLTGEKLILDLNGWEPQLMKRVVLSHASSDNRSRIQYEPAGPGPAPEVVTLKIPTPSRRLLVADWFRIDVFTQLVKEIEPSVSLNSDAGVLARMRALESLGVGTFFVGNTSPGVFQVGDQLVVSGYSDGPGGFAPAKAKASICTDLWWVTMVDVDVLKGLVARKVDQEEASRAVDDYIKNCGQAPIDVSGPEMYVHAPIYTPLMDAFHNDELSVELERVGAPGSMEEVYGVVSQRPLQFVPVSQEKDAAEDESAVPRPL